MTNQIKPLKAKYKSILISILAITLMIVCQNESQQVTSQAAKRDKGNYQSIHYIGDERTSLASKPDTSTSSSGTYEEIMKAFELVNEYRKDNNLEPYAYSIELEEAGSIRAKEASQLWSHTRPDGSEWWTVNEDIVYGENLAKGFKKAESVVRAWQHSPTHNANLLDNELKTIGMSIYINENGLYYWAQEFGY